jgi:hypothetical protein
VLLLPGFTFLEYVGLTVLLGVTLSHRVLMLAVSG